MSSRLLTRIEFGLAAALLLSVPVALSADKRQELYDRAVKAGSLSQVEDAARLFCEVAKMDPGFRDSKQMCTLMTHEAELERKRSDDRFAEAVKAFQDGRFDEAEQKFKNVRAGTHLEEAKQYLAKIPAARQERAATEAENAKFDHGVQAYKTNDFASAKSVFSQITGKRAAEAQVFLDNMKRFEQAMASGDAAAGSDPAKALASYNQAAAIKPDGPGDPRGKAARMQSQIASAAAAATAAAAKKEEPVVVPKPVAPAVTAVKETRPTVDVHKLLREAEAAQKRGDAGSASGKYLAVLAVDPGNAVARKALDALSAQGPARRQSAGSEADVMLARAIREFYTGYTEDAEVHIKDYINANGSKAALGYFYLGAIKLTRYYLAGERDSDKKLLSDAKVAFRVARGTAGFTPPSQQFISPKILKVYEQASQ